MQVVLIQILQWILRIVLLLLLFIFILVFLVMFVPIRYKADGKLQEKELKVKGKVTWFFYLIYVKFIYEEKFGVQIRVLGIPILDSNKKAKHKKSQKSNRKRSETGALQVSEEKAEKNSKLGEKEPDAFKKEEPQKFQKQNVLENPKKKQKTLGKRIEEIRDKIRSFFQRIKYLLKRIKEGKWKIEHYLNLWKKAETQITFKRAKKKFGKMIKSLFPKKWHVKGVIGFSEPSLTGQIMGVLGCLYPVFGSKVCVSPDFENEIRNIKADVKGHIRLGNLFFQLVSLLLNKYCLQFIRLILEELDGS